VEIFVDTIVEDNGKPDCRGMVTPVGDVAVIYIRFEDQGNAYLLCPEENLRSCYAIARRTSSRAAGFPTDIART
jgi:hypothetical protein